MTTQWDELYASNTNFKEYVLIVVEEGKVAPLTILDGQGLLSQYQQEQEHQLERIHPHQHQHPQEITMALTFLPWRIYLLVN
mmetsp:Transcript_18944/g.51916  ORF Transcript_18944/g.51916 Transcript_18944/m.51916 type:complete len:82 (+) Transcript_18944:1955-2200(+)